MTGDELEARDDAAVLVTRTSGVAESALSLHVPGTSDQVPVLRRELRRWLQAQEVPREVEEEVVLAAGEAVANAVEHAYAGRAPGSVDLTAWSAEAGAMICLEVTDHGVWRERAHTADRGRGLTIMRALLDSVDVVQTAAGTSVSMTKLVRSA